MILTTEVSGDWSLNACEARKRAGLNVADILHSNGKELVCKEVQLTPRKDSYGVWIWTIRCEFSERKPPNYVGNFVADTSGGTWEQPTAEQIKIRNSEIVNELHRYWKWEKESLPRLVAPTPKKPGLLKRIFCRCGGQVDA